MGVLHAYALAVAEARSPGAAEGAERDRLRALAGSTLAPGRAQVRDLLGPIHRRVPGRHVLRPDDPTPADLEAVLAGRLLGPDRARAGWRVVEALVAARAWGSVAVQATDLPAGLLAPLALPLAVEEGRTAGWCTPAAARGVPALGPWLRGFDGWADAAAREDRPPPDVVVLGS